MAEVLVVAHAVATLLLAGLSWTVAVVVYPGFAETGPSDCWRAVHDAHSRRMSIAVAPAWAVEGLTVAGLLLHRPAGVPLALVLLAAVAAAATVVLTVFGAVPLHVKLGQGYDPQLLRRLKMSHAWRTLAWTVAAATGMVMLLLSRN